MAGVCEGPRGRGGSMFEKALDILEVESQSPERGLDAAGHRARGEAAVAGGSLVWVGITGPQDK